MKVHLITLSVLYFITIWLGLVQSANMDYRYKPRGPPRPPRQPQHPQHLQYPQYAQYPHYLKKWEQNRPSRNSVRPPRPIPLEHITPNFLQPQVPSLMGPSIMKPQVPVRNIWQNQPAPLKVKQEKPYHFSPQINNAPEYDYQIQTNTIPTHSIPIKQVGEKGPIHTIPAPNLSPADRPAIIEEQKRPTYSYLQQTQPHIQQQLQQQTQQQTAATNSHQYQVTESGDHLRNAQKNYREQQLHFANAQTQHYKPSQVFNTVAETQSFANVPDQQGDLGLSQQEIFQLLNTHINQNKPEPQQLFNNYDVPLIPQALVQQPLNLHPHEISVADFNAMIGQTQAVQADAQYLKQIQANQGNQNIFSNQPNIQMFNFERHAQPSEQTYAYENDNAQMSSQPEPFIQEIFDLNEENIDASNLVESKSDAQEKISEGSVYYTSLPNRQAAEALATLQSAGKINNEIVNAKPPLEIYVPDSQQFTNFEVSSSIRHKKDGVNPADFESNDEYNDTQDKDENDDLQQQNQRLFGKRLIPK